MKSVIELKNAFKTWEARGRRIEILHDADVKVRFGESVAIMGPSGAGKSTLMHIMAFLTPLDKGKIFFQGEECKRGERGVVSKVHQNMAFVFQDAKLISSLNVFENVEVPLIHRGIKKSIRKDMIHRTLEKVSLTERKSHLPNQLSGGELMRVSIARAIISTPKVIFADEPTGSLDAKMGETVSELLYSFVKPTTSVVVVTHQQEVADMADRILYLKDGKILCGE